MLSKIVDIKVAKMYAISEVYIMLKIILIILFFPIAFPIWLISKLFAGHIDDGPDFLDDYDRETEQEKEMNRYGLEPWQKDLVRKGDYDPENFDDDEDDMEEDDYYYEDS